MIDDLRHVFCMGAGTKHGLGCRLTQAYVVSKVLDTVLILFLKMKYKVKSIKHENNVF